MAWRIYADLLAWLKSIDFLFVVTDVEVIEEAIEEFDALRFEKLLLWVRMPDGECSMITLDVGAVGALIDIWFVTVENTASCWFLKTPPALVLYIDADFTRLSSLALEILRHDYLLDLWVVSSEIRGVSVRLRPLSGGWPAAISIEL